MWTVPQAPPGFQWRLVGGAGGQGLADLVLEGSGHRVASVVRIWDGWAVLLGDGEAQGMADYRPAPSRDRALAWATRWAAARRALWEAKYSRPPVPAFDLAPPPPRRVQGVGNGIDYVLYGLRG